MTLLKCVRGAPRDTSPKTEDICKNSCGAVKRSNML